MNELTSGLVVPDLLRLRAEIHPDQIVMNVNGGETLTYQQWYQRANAVANELIARGVTVGQRIALLFGGLDWIDYAVAYMGVVTAGATAVHLHDGISPQELNRRVTDCGVVGLILTASRQAPEGFTGWSDHVSNLDKGDTSPVRAAIGPEDLAEILYTSGTTGKAKAICTPHGNLTFNRGPEGFRSLGKPEPLLAPIPLGTTSSATTVSVALSTRSTLVLCPVDDVERMAELAAKYRIKSFMLTPWIAVQLVMAKVHERHDLSCVDTIATASAPMPPKIARELLAMMPNAKLNSVYAAREAVPAVVMSTFDPERPFAVGRPAPGTQVLVVDKSGQPLAASEIGEIWLRCGAPKRLFLDGIDRAAQGDDEWTRTRDLGYFGEDGDLYLFDRDSDVARVNGKLVSTIEVEAVLYEHPAVAQVAVVASPAELSAFIVLAPGEEETAIDGIRQFATEQLEPHQLPSQYRVMATLPRGVMGKVLKHQLIGG